MVWPFAFTRTEPSPVLRSEMVVAVRVALRATVLAARNPITPSRAVSISTTARVIAWSRLTMLASPVLRSCISILPPICLLSLLWLYGTTMEVDSAHLSGCSHEARILSFRSAPVSVEAARAALARSPRWASRRQRLSRCWLAQSRTSAALTVVLSRPPAASRTQARRRLLPSASRMCGGGTRRQDPREEAQLHRAARRGDRHRG